MPDAFPTIPLPTQGNDESMFASVMAMKLAIETLQGQRGGQPVTRTFVQEASPAASNTGDQWIQPSTGKMSYWNGSKWMFVRGA